MTCLFTRPEGLYVERCVEPDLLELEGVRVGVDLRIVDELVRGVTLVRDLVLGVERCTEEGRREIVRWLVVRLGCLTGVLVRVCGRAVV